VRPSSDGTAGDGRGEHPLLLDRLAAGGPELRQQLLQALDTLE
jgi:hypothetical protein